MDGNISQALGDVQFAQFTAALITQTLDAVIEAQLQQEERVRKLQEAGAMDPGHFSAEVVSSEDVENELARIFPLPQYPKGVTPGASYTPPTHASPEVPPILDSTGYTMKEGDWTKEGNNLVISGEGYNNISSQVRQNLSRERQANIVDMLRRGIPRVVVDHGRVNAKLFFQFVAGDTSAGTPQLVKAALPRLVVKSVELRRPEVARLTVNVVGEVDITFKTISE